MADDKNAATLAAALEVIEALMFYADPESYFAVAVVGDPPCGDFIRDAAPLSEEDQEYYVAYRSNDGTYHGKRAREALAGWRAANQT